MPGSNNGTGHRLYPRCPECAKVQPKHRIRGPQRGLCLTVLGPRRERFTGNNGSGRMDSRYQYKVRCDDCGHEGWQRHFDVAKQWAREFGGKA